MLIEDFVPFIIIFTFPFIILLIFVLIKRSKRLVFLLDDKLLKSPIRLSTVLLGTAITFLLYSYGIHLLLDSDGADDYMWNLVGLLLSASHLAKTKEAPLNYTILYVFTMFIGLFVYGIFISNLVGFVKEKLKKLAKGRTNVVVEDHVLIIGKSKHLFPIIDQYIESTLSYRNNKLSNIVRRNKMINQKIVVLTNDLADDLMSEIEKNTSKMKSTKYSSEKSKLYKKELRNKIIYRTGSTSSVHDLEMCSIQNSQSVILLGDDSEKIKSLLAINATNFSDNTESFVISKFNDTEMLNVAERNDFSDDYDLININHLITNLTAHTTLQPNLSYVYNDLLDFSKSHIKFLPVNSDERLSSLVGKNFNYAANYLSNVSLIGIKNDIININPNADGNLLISADDELIIIRAPHLTVEVNSDFNKYINKKVINNSKAMFIKENLNLIIIGFNEDTYLLLTEFNNIISKDSEVTIICNDKYKKYIDPSKIISNIDVDYNVGIDFYSTFNQFEEKISDLDNGNDIDSIIVLPNKYIDKDKSDDDSIFTLTDLKHLERKNNRDYNITFDLSDLSNKNLIEHLEIADVIITDKISSQLIFQFATNRNVKSVYEELLSISGDEIYFNPIENYLTDLKEKVSFYTLSEAALVKNEIAIGFKDKDGVTMIDKDKSILEQFNNGDSLIVISKGH